MLIIKFSKCFTHLSTSKPCSHCILKLKKMSENKNYNIKNIFYSNGY